MWQQHLEEMSRVKKGVFLKSYAQKEPIHEFKTATFHSFMDVIVFNGFRSVLLKKIFLIENKKFDSSDLNKYQMKKELAEEIDEDSLEAQLALLSDMFEKDE
jgi:preprotein translocase subunit SecA